MRILEKILTGVLSVALVASGAFSTITAKAATTEDGTQSNPYLISSVSDLEKIPELVYSTTTGTDIYFKLTADISDETIGALDILSPSSEGSSVQYIHFDGDDYSFKDVTFEMSLSSGCTGLFGKIDGVGLDISNLAFDSCNTSIGYMTTAVLSTYGAGLIVGNITASAYEVTISNIQTINCVVGASVSDAGYIGGLVGKDLSLLTTTISKCENNNITVEGKKYIGGFVGSNSSNSGVLNINDCRNQGTSSISGITYVGGILGCGGASMTSVINKASVTGTEYVGGIVGNGCNRGDISYSENTGDITGTKYVGGYAGYAPSSIIDRGLTSNTGVVTGSIYTGGIVGFNKGTIKNVCNIGDVKGLEGISCCYLGGVVGWNAGTVFPAKNKAHVDGGNDGRYIGGVAGYVSSTGSLSHSSNWAPVEGGYPVGGVAGQNSGILSVPVNNVDGVVTGISATGGLVGANIPAADDPSNTGIISEGQNYADVTGTNIVGGVAGENDGIIKDSVNKAYEIFVGTVETDAESGACIVGEQRYVGTITGEENVGGIVGVNSGEISNCDSASNVAGTTIIGGIAGRNGVEGLITDCNNSGKITGTTVLGGIAGYNDGSILTSIDTGKVYGYTVLAGIAGKNSETGVVKYNTYDGDVSAYVMNDDSYLNGSKLREKIKLGAIVGDNHGIESDNKSIATLGFQLVDSLDKDSSSDTDNSSDTTDTIIPGTGSESGNESDSGSESGSNGGSNSGSESGSNGGSNSGSISGSNGTNSTAGTDGTKGTTTTAYLPSQYTTTPSYATSGETVINYLKNPTSSKIDSYLKKYTLVTVGNYTYRIWTNKKLGYKTNTVDLYKVANKNLKTIKIPSTVKIGSQTFKVRSVMANAAKNYTKATKIVIGKNVLTIGKNAFYGCKNLKTMTIKSSKLQKVGSKAFKGVKSTVKINVPNKKIKTYKKMFTKAKLSSKAKVY